MATNQGSTPGVAVISASKLPAAPLEDAAGMRQKTCLRQEHALSDDNKADLTLEHPLYAGSNADLTLKHPLCRGGEADLTLK